MQLIDSHAHVNFSAYREDADEVIQRSLDAGISLVNVGTQLSTSKRAIDYAHKYDGVWAAIGVHPIHLVKGDFEYSDGDELTAVEIKTIGEEVDFATYLELAKDEKVVALGEVGLDFHHFNEGDDVDAIKAKQREVLIGFIELANKVDKPVMIHCWDAYPELLEVLTQHPVGRAGVIHSFIGGYKTAKKFIDLGYMIGLNGIITYSDSYTRLINEIDLENIIVETDCPYLAPGEHKGERNEPLYVAEVAKKIADVKGISLDKVAKETTINVKKLFNI